MARNPDGTFQQGDPETRQAAQKGGQASHGSQRQNQNKQNEQNRQQSQNQGSRPQWGAPPKSMEDHLDEINKKN